MPEAIATTKRRFYQALDALNKPSSSLEKTALDASSVNNSNKRSSAVATAFDEARERARKRLRQSVSSASLSTLDQRGSVISLPRPSQSKDSRPPPNFAPWSQESFLARLKTFSSVSKWYPKPDVINEVEWAKRGWVRKIERSGEVRPAADWRAPVVSRMACHRVLLLFESTTGPECHAEAVPTSIRRIYFVVRTNTNRHHRYALT